MLLRLITTVVLSVSVIACDGQKASSPATQDQAPYVLAVNSPLAYFAQRLLDDSIEVHMLAPGDTDPAQWTPGVDEALRLQNAALVLLNGAGYESWTNKVAVAGNRLVNTSGDFREQWIELDGEVTHSHGPAGEHAHGGHAFTTWMDMVLARHQAEATARSLARQFPEQGPAIKDRLAQLLVDIDALDHAYREHTAQLKGTQVIYSHPVYQYFERAYELPGTSLHWEPDAMPDDDEWQALSGLARDEARFIWVAQPAPKIAGRMKALGISFLVIDPAANTADPDWLQVQRQNVDRLALLITQSEVMTQ